MKLLKELVEASGFSSLLVLTYGADLAWFEAVICRQLRTRGVHRFIVLADPVQLSATLEEQAGYLTGPGRAYSLLGVPVDGSFHPKAYLLTGKAGARLYVGSGNLTTSGLNGNLEVFERWDAPENSVRIPRAFIAFQRYVDKLLRERLNPIPGHLRDAFEALFSVAALGKPTESAGTELAGTPGSLWNQVVQPASPASRLIMMAPYFDAAGSAAVGLAEKLRATSFEVWTDKESTNLTPAAIDAISAAGGRISFLKNEPRAHAKVFYAEGADWKLSCAGSANLSQAAWQGRNAELVALRAGEAAAAIEALLAEKSVVALTQEDRNDLERRESLRNEQGEADVVSRDPSLRILSAQRDALGSALILEVVQTTETAPPDSAELLGHLGPLPLQLSTATEDSARQQFRCTMPAEASSTRRPLIVRLRRLENLGPWSVVHDRNELRLQSEAGGDDAVRRDLLLDAVITNPTNAEQLMEFLVEIHSRRVSRDRDRAQAVTTKVDSAGDKASNDDSWVWVKDDDFTQTTAPEDDPLRRPHTGDTATRILHRLLFGGTQDEADIDDGESGGGDDPRRGARSADNSHEHGGGRQASFFQLADAARSAYLAALAQGHQRDVVRLVEDLEVISVTLTAALRSGMLDPHTFVVQQVRLLREFLGSAHSPVVRALSAVEKDSRLRVWSDVPIATAVGLLLYNTVLPELGARNDETSALGLALWMRHLVRHSPYDQHELVEVIERQAARITRGALWIGDLWPNAANHGTAAQFIAKVVGDAFDLESFETEARSRVSDLLGRKGTDADSDGVLAVGRDGHLAPGFAEGVRAWIQDGAFQVAQPPAGSKNIPLHRVPTLKCAPLSSIEPWLRELSPSAQRGFSVLSRIA